MRYPVYTYPADALCLGSSLGNLYAFARLDARSNLRGLWSSSDNQYYVGEWGVGIHNNGKELEEVETVFSAESQTTRFAQGTIKAEKQFLLPFSTGLDEEIHPEKLRAAVYLVRLINTGADPVEARIHHAITIPPVRCDLFTKRPPDDQLAKRVRIRRAEQYCEITTIGKPEEARIFGSSVPWERCSVGENTLKVAYHRQLQPGESCELSFVITFSPDGISNALEGFHHCQDGKALLERSIHAYEEVLCRTDILTPDPLLNRGLQWAKVNMLRVQHNYRVGTAFTNDPPQDIVVVRDVAWYVLGSNYFTHEFSSKLLELCIRFGIHAGGKLTEYFHADEDHPVLHDYNLNINDDTPLFVYALYQYALTCGDNAFLERVYPHMKRACDWILSQMSDGLVWCRSEGTHVWGICSWRNIIDDYNLTGAVTEINAECFAALTATGGVAESLGKSSEGSYYKRAAQELKEAINTKLLSTKTGLYLLNMGSDGAKHHDITGDLVFPVLFGIAEDGMRNRILERLTDEDMWTPYGARTVSRHEANYDPEFGYQLVGGLWPNLTAWVAMSRGRDNPATLVEGMMNIYRLSEPERPVDLGNVVPGQFPERLHGTNHKSLGMAMSPWTPPTYLWLGVEGLLGFRPSLSGLEINPAIPSNWKWICVKNLPYRNNSLDAFLYDGVLYTTHQVASAFPVKIGTPVESWSDCRGMFTIGLLVDDQVLVFAAADEGAEGKVFIEFHNTIAERHLRLAPGEAMLLRMP